MSLQKGDLVWVVGRLKAEFKHNEGKIGLIDFITPDPLDGTAIFCLEGDRDRTPSGKRMGYEEASLRKINPGPEPGNESFADMMHKFTGVSA